MQACSNLGKHEEAVQGMEQLCQAKAQAAGPKAVQGLMKAGTSLDSRLQVSFLPPLFLSLGIQAGLCFSNLKSSAQWPVQAVFASGTSLDSRLWVVALALTSLSEAYNLLPALSCKAMHLLWH